MITLDGSRRLTGGGAWFNNSGHYLTVIDQAVYFRDDQHLRFGTTLATSAVILHSSSAVSADAEVTNVIEGTSAHIGHAADSIVISNIADDGDVHILVSKGGNSHTAFLADGSTGDTILNAASGQSVDVYIAGTKEIDYSTGAMAFQQATAISTTATTLTLNPATNLIIEAGEVRIGPAPIYLGTNTSTLSYRLQYNVGSTLLEIWSTDVDGAGADGQVITVDDGTNDVKFFGGISTDGASAPVTGIAVAAAHGAISGEVHALDLTMSGELSSGDSMVGGNFAVTPVGTAGTWVSGLFAKVTQDATKRVNGYISGAEFEVVNSAGLVSDWFPLVLNANNSGAQHGAHAAYTAIRDYGSTNLENLFWFGDQSIGTLSATKLLSTTNDQAATHTVKFLIGDVPYWFLARNVAPA